MKNTTFENIGGTYKMTNDYLIPELSIAESTPLGKWGLLRKHYLMDNHKALYSSWALTGELDKHLASCADCRKYLQLLEDIRDGLQEELPDPPDSLREGIMYKIGLEKHRKLHFGAMGRWTAIAAVLCIVVFGVVKLTGSGVMGSSAAAAPKAAAPELNSAGGVAVEYAVRAEAEEDSLPAESKLAAPSSLTGPTEAPAPEPAPAADESLDYGDRAADGMPGTAANGAESGSVYLADSLRGYDFARAALGSGDYWGVCVFYGALPEELGTGDWQTIIPEKGEKERWLLSQEALQALEKGTEWDEFYYGDLSSGQGLVIVIAGEEE